LWLFILSDAFVFAGLFVSRFFLLGFFARPELNQILGLVITIVLLASSFSMNRAETAMAYGDRKNFLRGVLVTLVLGVIFLIVVGVEGNRPFSFGWHALFYVMTGFCLHVLTGSSWRLSTATGVKVYSAERMGCQLPPPWHLSMSSGFFYPAPPIGAPVLQRAWNGPSLESGAGRPMLGEGWETLPVLESMVRK
jgi:hypothetical protein